jgi:hypothetical protein
MGGGLFVLLDVDVDKVLRDSSLAIGFFVKLVSRLLTFISLAAIMARSSSRSGGGDGEVIGASKVVWLGLGEDGGDRKCFGFTGTGGTLRLGERIGGDDVEGIGASFDGTMGGGIRPRRVGRGGSG